MSTVSIFNGGALNFALRQYFQGTVATGSIGIGGSYPLVDPSHAGDTITLAVDGAGVVSVTTTFPYVSENIWFQLYLEAPAGVTSASARNFSSDYVNAYVTDASVSDPTQLTLTQGVPYFAPNPQALGAPTSAAFGAVTGNSYSFYAQANTASSKYNVMTFDVQIAAAGAFWQDIVGCSLS